MLVEFLAGGEIRVYYEVANEVNDHVEVLRVSEGGRGLNQRDCVVEGVVLQVVDVHG